MVRSLPVTPESDQDRKQINWMSRQRFLELLIVVICFGIISLLYQFNSYKIIVLNLFFLPVVAAGFFLGRYRAGVLALFCVIGATVIAITNLHDFGSYQSPLTIALSITIWGAILGLTAIMVGTLSDEKAAKVVELHEAHVGVVEVLSKYLQSANPRLKDRALRVAELCRKVAEQMRLSSQESDDIRIAALLYDMENIQVTARVIRNAVGGLGLEREDQTGHTFHGMELVYSLGRVLTGAFPLLMKQQSVLNIHGVEVVQPADVPFGVRIIHSVRSYYQFLGGEWDHLQRTPLEALKELRADVTGNHHPAVVHALETVVSMDDIMAEPASARV